MTLPNFAIIGAGKSGTTALYHWLRQHPDVFMPASIKETFFFCYDPANAEHRALAPSRFPVTTLEQYEALFAAAGDARAIGEATPQYLDAVHAPQKMSGLLPHAKLIASLRDPVSRVYSHAQMSIRNGEASDLYTEVRRLAASDEQLYAPKFERWFSRFPTEQFCVFRYEDLRDDPDAVLRRVFRFLGVDDGVAIDTDVVHNPGGLPRSSVVQRVIDLRFLRALRPIAPMAAFNLVARIRRWNAKPADELPTDLREELIDRYRPDILATQELLGLDLRAWLA